ncbi:class I SAM-dependent methyltransferase [Angustibacter luteus]|uniref:Class I SAM-dependent methyltransferase n=1 Tax=Angustibacter luteus TaxID=658456 RepID=A0ABW1JAH2_9ACTN
MTEESVTEAMRRDADSHESASANRSWWDAEAADYYAEHGSFLGDGRFVWGPEGLDEADAGLLGDVRGRRVLEVGAGAGQCSRWLAAQGAQPVAVDLSIGMLRQGVQIDPGTAVPMIQADACALPLADASVDVACSAYGAVPFVADAAALMREVARVLRPGGRWVFSTTHPVRWALPDDPGEAGLVVRNSYFDRTPYVEEGEDGRAVYVEHHRTLGDRVRDLVGAGFVLDDVVEPEWPQGHEQVWGGWSPLRGRLVPGTTIFVSHLPTR